MRHADLVDRKAGQFIICDPSSQRLGALLEQRRRGAAENQEPSRTPRAIDKHAQHLEQIGLALNLIEDHQSAQGLERQERISQTGLILWIFQIEIDRRSTLSLGDRTRQSRFPDLPSANDADDGMTPQQPTYGREMSITLQHASSIP